MKPSLPSTQSASIRSWQAISQKAAGRALSPVARRKRLVKAFGLSLTLLTAAGLGWLAMTAVRLHRHETAALRNGEELARLEKVEFFSDGVLTEEWARHYLDLREGEPLANYDVFALQKKLLEAKQVREAFVERALPGSLRLRMTERTPLVRVAANDDTGGYQTLFVARDGTVFEGHNYREELVKTLPWLDGVRLEQSAQGAFGTLRGLDVVGALLDEARRQIPRAVGQWTVVDLGAYDPRGQAPLSLIRVRTRDLGELVFQDHDFRQQVERLDFIAGNLQDQKLQARRVDLSFERLAAVQIIEPPKSPAAPRRAAVR